MVVFDAAPFYNDPPVQFRGIEDSLAIKHLEGSGCCLIHSDNSLSEEKGVWLNPNVRAAYNADAKEGVMGRNGMWLSKRERVFGIWKNRLARWMGLPWRVKERRLVEKRIREWEEAGGEYELRKEDGTNCVGNEMQILVGDGWLHL